MGLYRRGKTYWFNVKFRSKRIQGSLETNDKRLAEKVYEKVLGEIVDGTYFERHRVRTTTIDEMIEKYLKDYAKSRDHRTAGYVLKFFSGMRLLQITTPIIQKYRVMRLKKVKPATVYLELAFMRRMYNVAIREWEWLSDNPVSRLSFGVGNSNARDRWLTDVEEKSLLENADRPYWLRSLVVFALHTGMRKSEILDLKWRDVDLKRKVLTVVKSKNSSKRTLPLNETLFEELCKVRQSKVMDFSGRVFPVSYNSLRHAFDKAVDEAGIEDFRFHDLRHSFATRLVQNGVDLYKVKELLGHKTISMTMRYAHHYPESLRSSVNVLDLCYNSATVVV